MHEHLTDTERKLLERLGPDWRGRQPEEQSAAIDPLAAAMRIDGVSETVIAATGTGAEDGEGGRPNREPVSARRVSVEKNPGVYYRDTPKGRRYEITFLDSDGRRRWRTVEGGLKDARAALTAVRGRVDRGDDVRPTRVSFKQYAEAWLDGQANLRPKTRRLYRWALDAHLLPAFGGLKVHEIRADDVAALLAKLRREGYSPHTERAVLTPLSRLMATAARRGMIAANPCDKLDRSERPKLSRHQVRVLSRDEMVALLDHADARYRPVLACAMFSGLRLSELVALMWADIDFERGLIHVSRQLSVRGQRVAPKTPQAVRSVVLMPSLARLLREHRAASAFSQGADFVFSSATGGPLDGRNVAQRGLRAAAVRAGLVAAPPKPVKDKRKRKQVGSQRGPRAHIEARGGKRARITMHELRHCFASLLIAQGEDVTFVGSQLGHANPSITLRVYAHLFEQARHADRARDRLEAAFGSVLEARSCSDGSRSVSGEGERVVSLRP